MTTMDECGETLTDEALRITCRLPAGHDWPDRDHEGGDGEAAGIKWMRDEDSMDLDVCLRVPPIGGEGKFLDVPGVLSLLRTQPDRLTVIMEATDDDDRLRVYAACVIQASELALVGDWLGAVVADARERYDLTPDDCPGQRLAKWMLDKGGNDGGV